MEVVKLSNEGKLEIPKAIRDAGHFEAGAELAVSLVDGEIRIRRIAKLQPTTLDEVAGCLHKPARQYMDEVQTRQAIAALLEAEDRRSRRPDTEG